MFKVTSDISLALRREFPTSNSTNVASDVIASGYAGSWVQIDSNGVAYLANASGVIGFPVWNESNRDGTQGWSPDVTHSNKVSTFVGKVFATTDRFHGAPTLGAPLVLSCTQPGKLTTTSGTDTAAIVVAYCMKASYSLVNLGTTYTVIDIVTV
jgi:hypothetical protein